ncbi:hypothetical protein [Leifsonia sp. Leaf264]|uniref:hypothetical protein n=1 Tax=Leifsonia sp. Leaf264 TaxID=1736314 RepID=UPI0006F6C6B4|nr:hypothetical protein [Leifsonia sp. Leaf264]KQO98364.1 hypothetical protein ASF30_09905 [Leifsonia sp. Leaf264]
MTAPTAVAELRNPADYDGSPVCPCCGSGWAHCTDGFAHEESCSTYRTAGFVCARCAAAYGWEYDDDLFHNRTERHHHG